MAQREDVTVDGVLVVGLGGIGSSVVRHLAARGETVVGLDPRPTGHRDGSSHGSARLVRQAYFEDPDYVPLATRVWRLWRELEREAGEHLLTEAGVLAIARRDDPRRLIPATLEAARLHGLAVDHLDAAAIRARFPAVRVPDDWEGAFEREAGYVDPEATIRVQTRLARAAGADLRAEEVLRVDPEGPVVETATARYRPRSLVITAGPWAPGLLGGALPVFARRKTVAHFTPLDETAVSAPATPGYLVSTTRGTFYGFPAVPGEGVRIGRHDGGETTTPDTVDRTVREEEVEELRSVLAEFLPAAAGPVLSSTVCLYTMSPDEDFLLGALPGADAAFVATGCSGHAFKFVPVLGEVLADLATGRAPAVPIGFLDPARFGRASAAGRGRSLPA